MDELFFGLSASALTSDQLSHVVFSSPNGIPGDCRATILATGEIVPVPEPTTLVLLGGALLAGGIAVRRRSQRTPSATVALQLERLARTCSA
jgi:hypothetical protein